MKPTYEELQRELRAADATITNLEARFAALAAENMAMKQAIDQHRYGFVVCPSCRLEISSSTDDVCYVLDKTPATDAAIAELRAQGVEMAVDVVKRCYDNICPGGLAENRQYEESMVQPHLDGIADELQFKIEQLRAEASK